MAEPERLRLFFAVPLDEALRDRACALQEELARVVMRGTRVKFVERANLHLTLRFVGEMSAEVAPELCRVADEVAALREPMALEVAGMGCFPPRGAPRTLWLGLSRGEPELADLARRLDVALLNAGLVEPEPRPFTGHFTLGRVRAGGAELRAAAERLADVFVGAMQVDHFALLSSDLTTRGPIYTELRRFRLGG